MLRAGRCTVALATASVLLMATGAARAQTAGDTKVRCAAAYEQAQELRRQDKLSAARGQLLICEQTCPRSLVADCSRWKSEVVALMPTVRLRASDGQGRPVLARVFVDGSLLAPALPDAAIAVDAGEHTFRFETPSGSTDEVRLALHGGEREREVAAVLTPPRALTPTPARETPHVPVAAIALGAAGAAGLGLALALSIDGHVRASDLQQQCSPACSPSRVDAVAGVYDAAWVSGGIGLASVAVALLIWKPWLKAAASGSGSVFVSPAHGGALVGWRFP